MHNSLCLWCQYGNIECKHVTAPLNLDHFSIDVSKFQWQEDNKIREGAEPASYLSENIL